MIKKTAKIIFSISVICLHLFVYPSYIYAQHRVVSISPHITEILFAIGLDEEIVGVTNYCVYPPEARMKGKIGGYIDPNLEKIVSLKPDMVLFDKTIIPAEFPERLSDFNIRCIAVETRSVEDIYVTIEEIGVVTGRESEAKDLVESIKEGLGLITSRVKEEERKRVAIIYGNEPIFIAGKRSFADELISFSGGINIAKSSLAEYPRYSIEEIVVADPEVIIDASMGTDISEDSLIKVRERWEKWSSISAVRNNKIYIIDVSLITVPGPRIVETIRKLNSLIESK